MNPIKDLQLYYFSGTGNSKNVCLWIQEEFEAQNHETKLIDIGQLKIRKAKPPQSSTTIGFVSPTHGFNFPPIMLHFILRFPPTHSKNSVIIINTRAGMKFGKVYLPGLSGIAQYFAAIILRLKGYHIIAMKPVDLPSNWISLHPGLKQKVVDSIYIKREAEVRNFTRKILSGHTNYRALYDLVQDILLTPVAFGYYFFGRFLFAKSFIASHKCTKCKQCMNQCPINAIKWVDKRPFWKYTCESCMLCMSKCPVNAIETAHGFIFLIAFLVNSIILAYLYSVYDVIAYLSQIMPHLAARSLQMLLSTVIMFLLLLPMYRLMHFLMRYKPIERLVIHTSLTSYKFWRRYKTKTK